VGRVDKFQGPEAPVVFYSLATSTPEDAPRGMKFLYSLNGLNVAVSRARCVAVLIEVRGVPSEVQNATGKSNSRMRSTVLPVS
jgi:superfamily I DNA and/or RNA helicase